MSFPNGSTTFNFTSADNNPTHRPIGCKMKMLRPNPEHHMLANLPGQPIFELGRDSQA